MTCPVGCLRLPGHPGFHTTHPQLAKYEDEQIINKSLLDIHSPPNSVDIRGIEANALMPFPTKPNTFTRIYNVKPKHGDGWYVKRGL